MGYLDPLGMVRENYEKTLTLSHNLKPEETLRWSLAALALTETIGARVRVVLSALLCIARVTTNVPRTVKRHRILYPYWH